MKIMFFVEAKFESGNPLVVKGQDCGKNFSLKGTLGDDLVRTRNVT